MINNHGKFKNKKTNKHFTMKEMSDYVIDHEDSNGNILLFFLIKTFLTKKPDIIQFMKKYNMHVPTAKGISTNSLVKNILLDLKILTRYDQCNEDVSIWSDEIRDDDNFEFKPTYSANQVESSDEDDEEVEIEKGFNKKVKDLVIRPQNNSARNFEGIEDNKSIIPAQIKIETFKEPSKTNSKQSYIPVKAQISNTTTAATKSYTSDSDDDIKGIEDNDHFTSLDRNGVYKKCHLAKDIYGLTGLHDDDKKCALDFLKDNCFDGNPMTNSEIGFLEILLKDSIHLVHKYNKANTYVECDDEDDVDNDSVAKKDKVIDLQTPPRKKSSIDVVPTSRTKRKQDTSINNEMIVKASRTPVRTKASSGEYKSSSSFDDDSDSVPVQKKGIKSMKDIYSTNKKNTPKSAKRASRQATFKCDVMNCLKLRSGMTTFIARVNMEDMSISSNSPSFYAWKPNYMVEAMDNLRKWFEMNDIKTFLSYYNQDVKPYSIWQSPLVVAPNAKCNDPYRNGAYVSYCLYVCIDISGINEYRTQIDHVKTFMSKFVKMLNEEAFKITYVNAFINDGSELFDFDNFPPKSTDEYPNKMLKSIGPTEYFDGPFFSVIKNPNIVYTYNNSLDTWMCHSDILEKIELFGLDQNNLTKDQCSVFFRWLQEQPTYVPIPSISVPCERKCCRATFMPLCLSFGRTIHTFQGQEAGPGKPIKYIVVDVGSSGFEGKNPGTLYTAISRASTIGNGDPLKSALYFNGELEFSRLTNVKYKRLKGKYKNQEKVEYDKVKFRTKWIDHLESNLNESETFSNEEKLHLRNWAMNTTISHETLDDILNFHKQC